MNISRKLDCILSESAIDPTRKDLDPAIFEKENGEYKMKTYIRRQLADLVDEINKEVVSINDWFIKGSLLSYQWLDWTDLDLLIEIDNMPDEEWNELRRELHSRYGNEKVAGTEHPVEIFPQRGKYERDRADGLYDAKKNKWIKGPYDLTVNIDDYTEYFKGKAQSFDLAIGELKRDIIDYMVLQSLKPEEIKELSGQADRKIGEINKDIAAIVDQYENIRKVRHSAFEDDMTPEQIKEYGSKNKLPANVVQKMLERYLYMRMAWALKKLLDEDDIDTQNDVEKVGKITNLPSLLTTSGS